jgi:hypothetical protein
MKRKMNNNMKRNLFLMMLALTATTAVRASEVNDSIVIDNPAQVTVVKTDSLQKVAIVGKQGDTNFRYSSEVPIDKRKMAKKCKDDKDKTSRGELDFGVGVNIPTNVGNHPGFAVMKSKDIFFGFRYCYTPKGKLQTYSVGLWFDWRDYCTPKYNRIYKNNDGIVSFEPYPNNVSDTRSLIRVFSLQVPLLFTQQFGHNSKVKLTLGPVLSVNVRGRINNEWTVDDVDYESSTRGIGQRPFTVEFFGALQYKDCGIYCKYSPMSVLKSKSANGMENPQFHSLSLGFFF